MRKNGTYRILICTLFPSPLFCGIYFLPYFYKTIRGYDHETQQYTESSDFTHLGIDVMIIFFGGFITMLIPSLIYAFVLEKFRQNKRTSEREYIALGGVIGGISGLIYTSIDPGGFIYNHAQTFGAVILASTIGAAIPFILTKLKD